MPFGDYLRNNIKLLSKASTKKVGLDAFWEILKRIAFSVRKRRYPGVFFEICGEIIRVGKTKRECDLSYRFIGVFEKSFGFFKSYLVYFGLKRDISRLFENISHIGFGIVQPF